MRINDEQGNYHGWYQPQIGCFTQNAELSVASAIKINQDVIETLRIAGCKTIEAATYKDGHAEPYYIGFERFMEVADTEWDDEAQVFNLVYHIKPERQEPDERREMRENLQP